MRPVSVALANALAQPVTSVGYLIQWNFPSIARWCNIGTVTWAGLVFIEYDFVIDSLVQDPDTDYSCKVTAENVDNAAAALFLTAYTPDLTADIWQFERSAIAALDPQKLCTLVVDSLSITPEKMEVTLLSTRTFAAFSPRRRVDSTFGFSYALPANSSITWENEVFVIDQEQDTSVG